ncbi:MAG: hypothetical protein E6Q97_29105 [Desulfurellales bacterium]|nr:MAG: hypothetical protein E6Q97_29105 [Desulfurellales bacterium]
MAKKQPSKRRGKAAKSEDGAATFETGGAEAPKGFSPEEIANELGCWWLSGKDSFMRRDAQGRWHPWSQQALIDAMRKLPGRMIAIKARDGEMLSEAKEVLHWVREHRSVDAVMVSLPGYSSGIYDLPGGERVLVKTSPERLEPCGEAYARGLVGDDPMSPFPVIRAIIEGMLGADDGVEGSIDQTPWFWSLCKTWYRAFMTGSVEAGWKQGHAVIFTGTHGCGKNLVQELILTPLIGGRFADPLKHLLNEDQFNGDTLVEGWLLSELPSSQRTEDRVALAERIKQTVANRMMRARLMRAEPSVIQPFIRLSISVNDDADTLRSLPVVTDGYGDKIIIFHCRKKRLPILGDAEWTPGEIERADGADGWEDVEEDNSYLREREIRRVIRAELPAFAYWLKHIYKIPAKLITPEYEGDNPQRFGFRSFHHPVIREQLFDDTPAAQLLRLIDMAEFEPDPLEPTRKLWELGEPFNHLPVEGRWWGTAETLQQLLTGELVKCSVETLAKPLFAKNKRESLLTKLASDESTGGASGRVYKDDKHTRTRMWRGWWVNAPVAALTRKIKLQGAE